jgi:hypothetical protein
MSGFQAELRRLLDRTLDAEEREGALEEIRDCLTESLDEHPSEQHRRRGELDEWWEALAEEAGDLRDPISLFGTKSPSLLQHAAGVFQKGTDEQKWVSAHTLGEHESPEARDLFERLCRPWLEEQVLHAPNVKDAAEAAEALLDLSHQPAGAVRERIVQVHDQLMDAGQRPYMGFQDLIIRRLPEFECHVSGLLSKKALGHDEYMSLIEDVADEGQRARAANPSVYESALRLLTQWTQHSDPEVAREARACLMELNAPPEKDP